MSTVRILQIEAKEEKEEKDSEIKYRC